MLATLAATLLLGQRPSDTRVYNPKLTPRPGAEPRLSLYWEDRPLPVTKLSPKKFGPTAEPYTFDWVVGGLVRTDDRPEAQQRRFLIFNQVKPKDGDETYAATRFLLRLWESLDAWGADHSFDYSGGTVDVYLCWGGTPGGEAHFDHDPQIPSGANPKVATMYIYDLPSLKDPVERAREFAHEYGHLVLPAIGNYSAPEDWANGVLGERLFLTQLARDLGSNAVPATDAFGLTEAALAPWLAKNVTPHLTRAALEGPFAGRYARRDAVGMDAFTGEASLLHAMLPAKRFGRALRLMESQSAAALIRSAPLAVEEGPVDLTIPPALKGKTIWVPVGKTKLSGGKILATRAGWARVKPAGARLSLKPLPPKP